ncbi:hypothetical protein BJP36_38385 [Moorena producens JHB]|uniref:Uncharacterized protein n=1 Tax=Moorena producens (strain JHB) TaxID=1454205 RepID=A0A9Q9UWJ3_MOOP1|nr:hypothetical protein [Moorena producens]WAN69949.1 hypothetical protein BJP36_38385 [Moorena producens JHB]
MPVHYAIPDSQLPTSDSRLPDPLFPLTECLFKITGTVEPYY